MGYFEQKLHRQILGTPGTYITSCKKGHNWSPLHLTDWAITTVKTQSTSIEQGIMHNIFANKCIFLKPSGNSMTSRHSPLFSMHFGDTKMHTIRGAHDIYVSLACFFAVSSLLGGFSMLICNWPITKTHPLSYYCCYYWQVFLTQWKIHSGAKRKLTGKSRLLLVWNKVSAFRFCNFLRNSNNKYRFVTL